MGGCCDGCRLRGVRHGRQAAQIRLVAAVDGVHSVVDRALHHRQMDHCGAVAADRGRGRAASGGLPIALIVLRFQSVTGLAGVTAATDAVGINATPTSASTASGKPPPDHGCGPESDHGVPPSPVIGREAVRRPRHSDALTPYGVRRCHFRSISLLAVQAGVPLKGTPERTMSAARAGLPRLRRSPRADQFDDGAFRTPSRRAWLTAGQTVARSDA